jgi:kanamycin nucleotidyltransferase
MPPPTFSHQQRLATARTIFERLRACYGSDLLAVAIEGSVAKRIDGPYSDLELRAILRRDVDRWYAFFYQGLFCGVSYTSLAQAEIDARRIDYQWPVTFDRMVTRRVLYDPDGVFTHLAEVARAAERMAPWEELVRDAVTDMYEQVAKVFNALEAPQGSYEMGAVAAARNVAYWSALAVALYNRHRYRSIIRMYDEAISLPMKPYGYEHLLPPLLSVRSDMETLATNSWELWLAMRQWAEQLHIALDDDALQGL